jgi:hypothetical protein
MKYFIQTRWFICTAAILLFSNSFSFAQFDTTYYKKYDDRFIVALYQSFVRQFDISISQKMISDTTGKSALHYMADANAVSGIELDYDKLGISFGYKSVPPQNETKKGKTYYTDLGFSLGGNKWIIESSYRKYRGFYDLNTSRYDPAYNDSTPYFQNPSMTSEMFKAKFLYFTNSKKFSYKAAYTCCYRQLRCSASWTLVGNLYHYKVSADTSIIPHFVNSYYGSFSDLNKMQITGISAGGGASVNIVLFKSIFANLTFVMGWESQWRNYHHYSGDEALLNYISLSGDLRSSIGYNGKSFFIMLNSKNDITAFSSGQMDIVNKFVSGAFTLGYRFRIKKPGIFKKLEKTKVHQLL